MADPNLIKRAGEIESLLYEREIKVCTVESATGGAIANLLTDLAGASAIFSRGFISYSNEAKHEVLEIPIVTLEKHGAVSEETAKAMALAGLNLAPDASIVVSSTGVAGPSSVEDKPVGLMHLACAHRDGTVIMHSEIFQGNRRAVREAAVLKASPQKYYI